jgi:ketosteroid isomerase-like protein
MRLLILLLLSVFGHGVLAQMAGAEHQVRQADAQLNTFILKNNSDDASGFYAEEFILTTSSGKSKQKEDLLKEIASSQLILAINETTDVKVRVLGTTAVLTGVLHQKGTYKGTSFDVSLRVTDTWVRTETGWKILAGHASSLSKT